jgi:hypothetical protein
MVTMLWMDSVRSEAYQTPNTTARIMEKIGVVVASGILKLSVRLSVIRVPTTLSRTTTDQYTAGT